MNVGAPLEESISRQAHAISNWGTKVLKKINAILIPALVMQRSIYRGGIKKYSVQIANNAVECS